MCKKMRMSNQPPHRIYKRKRVSKKELRLLLHFLPLLRYHMSLRPYSQNVSRYISTLGNKERKYKI
jgi:hypothetical protein